LIILKADKRLTKKPKREKMGTAGDLKDFEKLQMLLGIQKAT
jgi:hypothetical protein